MFARLLPFLVALLLAPSALAAGPTMQFGAAEDVVRSTAVFRGIQGRVQFAEAFLPLRLFINVSQLM